MVKRTVSSRNSCFLTEIHFYALQSKSTGATRKETVPAAPWLSFLKENWKPSPDLEGVQTWAEYSSSFHDFGPSPENGTLTKGPQHTKLVWELAYGTNALPAVTEQGNPHSITILQDNLSYDIMHVKPKSVVQRLNLAELYNVTFPGSAASFWFCALICIAQSLFCD